MVGAGAAVIVVPTEVPVGGAVGAVCASPGTLVIVMSLSVAVAEVVPSRAITEIVVFFEISVAEVVAAGAIIESVAAFELSVAGAITETVAPSELAVTEMISPGAIVETVASLKLSVPELVSPGAIPETVAFFDVASAIIVSLWGTEVPGVAVAFVITVSAGPALTVVSIGAIVAAVVSLGALFEMVVAAGIEVVSGGATVEPFLPVVIAKPGVEVVVASEAIVLGGRGGIVISGVSDSSVVSAVTIFLGVNGS